MANIFLSGKYRDVETAVMLERAVRHDIGKAVAYTDGDRVYVNTDDNLYKILPAYDEGMLKWLLWHERYHNELRHHSRFYKYLEELTSKKLKDKFQVTMTEVNIIMDILVHDSLSRLFPELVDTAKANLAQFRNRNSLKHTFKTFTLEEMLDEYKESKKDEETGSGRGSGEDKEEDKPKDDRPGEGVGDTKSKDDTKSDKESEHKDSRKSHSDTKSEAPKEAKEKSSSPAEEGEPSEERAKGEQPEHDKTDWSKLKDIDTDEFITESQADYIDRSVKELQRKKLRLARLTETLNGLATSTRCRTYAMPSVIKVGHGVVLKGSRPGKAQLYLCFDASGSMSSEMELFKEIISKSIPQAMHTPTTWFSGYAMKDEAKIDTLNVPHIRADGSDRKDYDYYKGEFKDFMNIDATSGYDDDGDRTIELCWNAEQKGFSPIGITDGGGGLYWSKDKLKQLKRTVIVCQNQYWLNRIKEINPNIQTLYVGR